MSAHMFTHAGDGDTQDTWMTISVRAPRGQNNIAVAQRLIGPRHAPPGNTDVSDVRMPTDTYHMAVQGIVKECFASSEPKVMMRATNDFGRKVFISEPRFVASQC